MKVTCRTWWRLHVVHTKFDIYIFTIYIYFFHNQCKIFKLLQLTCDFFFTIKLFFDYLQYSNISKLWENSNQTLSFPSHILAYSKGNNSYNNKNLELNLKGLLESLLFKQCLRKLYTRILKRGRLNSCYRNQWSEQNQFL